MGDNDLSSGVVQFLPLLIIFAVYYLFIIRPRQKKRGPWVAVSISGSGCPTGQVTRLLCASAFLGTFVGFSTLRQKMIRFYENSTRATAPELGFDARLVLRACQIARRRAQRYAVLLVGVTFLTLLLASGMGEGAIVVGLAISWGIYYFKLLRDHTSLIRPFRRDAFDESSIADHLATEPLDERLGEALPSERQNLLVYASFLPFVGAGVDLGGWSLSSFVDKVKADAGKETTKPFTIEELYNAVNTGIMSLNISGLRAEDWYFANGADVRGNKHILYDVDARPFQHLPQDLATAYLRSSDRQVRHYKWIRIEDWGGELVVSYFLRCARVGESLFVETRQFLMAPLAGQYRAIDSLPESGTALHLTCLLKSLVTGAVMLVAAPLLVLISALDALAKRSAANRRRSGRLRSTMQRLAHHNYGAITSLRASLAQPNFLHYFQQSDANLYRKVLERKLLDIIITFLDAHDVDTSDIRERQTTILNSGILIQSGNVRAESLAVGQGATAIKTESAQTVSKS
jgi:hypothetical protein